MRAEVAEPQHQALSRDNPWPGLDPFAEADRDYFHGRAVEVGELLRLVRRERLTVLFGRSGLGKTSLLKAGLFPQLRSDDYLPVYVRLDYAEEAPALPEQVFRGLQAACDADRAQSTRPARDESLWSFFHRRDAEFWSERNRPLTPVIVFDQLEEIFTLGQETAMSRARSASFLCELGDLVENRLPETVRRALEPEPSAARRFDFKRSMVKLVLSFREDFLAEMEGLKEGIPSLMYNRFRLLAMSGAQAYQVITCAGGHLVDDDVARQILRLAWEPGPSIDPAGFPEVEIDPALLSVVCSELNQKRQQARPPLDRITPALLAGADRQILSGFYERSMAGLDPRVRAFVEDELITDGGYRDSHALEDARARISPAAVDALIRRRLLRVDERQSVRRLELTHDVLTRVVKESRDHRRAREAEEAAKVREQSARQQQQLNRRNAAFVLAGAFVVMILAALAGWFAWAASQARRQAVELLRQTEGARLMVTADQIQDSDYDASLLVNLEATRAASETANPYRLLTRFASHPHLSSVLSGHTDGVDKVAFSADGKLLASASADKTVILWDVESRRSLATLRGHQGEVNDVAFSPDAKLLASASGDKTIVLWGVDNRRPVGTLRGHQQEVASVAFSPDGTRLASASFDGTVILWDVDRRKPLATLKAHKDKVMAVAFSPDGKLLASASLDSNVILWDVDSRKPLARLRHDDRVLAAIFSPDGKRLVSASSNNVIVWDVGSRKRLATLTGPRIPVDTDLIFSLSFSPNGKRLASANLDGTVTLWNMDSRKPLATLAGHKDGVNGLAFSPDGERLASAGNDHTVILWDVESNGSVATLEGHGDGVPGVAFSPDGKWLASANRDRTVILWDVKSRAPLAVLKGHKDIVRRIAFSPDGKLLASASEDRTVILWDVGSRKLLATLEGHQDQVWDVAFSRDGKFLASASWDHTVMLWDVTSLKALATLKGHKDKVLSVAFSPDGKSLASSGEDHAVILWNVDSRQSLAILEGHSGSRLWCVRFSPDGKRIAAASWDDRTVILWDVDSRKPLATLRGHKDKVMGVAFSPDAKLLASSGWDKTVILWDLDSRKSLATLRGHQDAVAGLAFSPDGKRLASASLDNTVMLWNLDFDSLIAEACHTANRNLTCQEWRSYIGTDKPYHKTCAALPGPERCD